MRGGLIAFGMCSCSTINNLVQGNYIGTDASGTAALGNSEGVQFDDGAAGNTVGGTTAGAGNTIAFNNASGVFVKTSTGGREWGISIEGNSIHSNGGLGIKLDNDTNNNQTAPNITSVTTSSSTTITGTLSSVANTTFRIELFSSGSCDPAGSGEGEKFLDSVSTTTNGAGAASFTKSVPAILPGQAVTATATNNSSGDTSMFSACFTSPPWP